jgi:hypothetical protein
MVSYHHLGQRKKWSAFYCDGLLTHKTYLFVLTKTIRDFIKTIMCIDYSHNGIHKEQFYILIHVYMQKKMHI